MAVEQENGDPGKIRPRTEEDISEEIKIKMKKYLRGEGANLEVLQDKKLKGQLAAREKLYGKSAMAAAKAEKWLMPTEGGYLEAEGIEKTWRIKQESIAREVDISSSKNQYDIVLPELGPYSLDYTSSGRYMALAGRKGHLAIIDVKSMDVIREIQVRETVRDVVFLHNELFFAAAQKKYTYIYNRDGTELHCLQEHGPVLKLQFLKNHFLLASMNKFGQLRYQDVTTGVMIGSYRTGQGRCDVMQVNPFNGVVASGHSGGTVNMWKPTSGAPLVKMLCHQGPVTSLAFHPNGHLMATAGMDKKIKLWDLRKFDFFEEKYGGKISIPDEVTGKLECCTSGRGKIVVGCDDGTVSLLDRGFKFNYGFQAHTSSVLFLHHLKQRNFLVTVGEDEEISLQKLSFVLKVFDLDKTLQPEGPSTSSPECIQILRIFTDDFPEAKITSFSVLEEAPPILLIAFGLDNGCIYYIRGDIARKQIKRFKLQVEITSDKSQLPIKGLAFRVDGQTLQLFAVTPTSVSLFNFRTQPPSRQTLDHIGCNVSSVALSDRLELIMGRPEAVYFYEVDGRGPCWAFEGEKKFLGWFRGYLLCIVEDQRTGQNIFNVYDLKNRLIAHSISVNEVSHMLCEWGNVVLVMTDNSVLCIGEKDMESKLDMLFKKNLYTVAINLVQSQQADAAATAEVLRKYADHLYSKQDYDEAMSQYIHTIGHLEPSYVIQKFLDAQRIYNLTNYLEKLHEKGLASKDHTTLLLNCFTKLKDVEKLNVFIKSEDGERKFDVETAIKVCRAANYHEHAMYVAKKAGRHEWYLKILLEDLGSYEEALQYISSLEPSQAGVTIKEYGKILIEHKPVETIEILLGLCTEEGEAANRGASNGTYVPMLPSPVDFLNIFIHHPHSLMDFLEKYTNKVKDSPAQLEIHNTLLEIYLSNDLNFLPPSQVDVGENGNLRAEQSSVEGKDANKAKECHEKFQKGLRLLKSAWPSDQETPMYDVDLAIILCEMNSFREGLLFLYEKMKLYKEVIGCYMQAHDHEGLIKCCKRLGDSGKGGDSSLWADLLKYFGELGEDCSEEVKEVLSYIERDDILPPIIVLQTLSRNPCLTLSVIKDYIARKLEQESKLIEQDRGAIEKYQEETLAMRKEIHDLRTKARIFQLSKCTACTFTLDLPAVHFMCMHSFHQRCLGDNEKECPECAPEYRSVLEMKKSLEQNSKNQDQFFQQVKSSKDGFSVIAEYFGKGLISKTTIGSADSTLRSGNKSSSSSGF